MSVAQVEPNKSVAEITYEDLYQRWEQGNWSAYDLDFSKDREGWDSLSDIQRKSALWIYSMFFYGEDAVTDGLSPYIEAAPLEEQKYFLATQQVDEARHAVFFDRFFGEVIGAPGESLSDHLDFTKEHLGWGYRGVFGRLEKMVDELHTDRSYPKFVQAITLYHLVVEAVLAQPGQHFIEDFFAKAGTMPGFSEGMGNVSRDEQRHIGFGVKVLSEAIAGPQSEECKAAIVELMREIMPYAVGVLTPPGWDRDYTRAYGFELEDIYAWGMRSVEMKWKMIGFPLHEMPGVYPFDPEMPHRERAERQIAMLQAGVLGEPNGKIDASPEVQGYFFDVIAKSADQTAITEPLTIQWKFSDAEPWHVRLDNGSSVAAQGLAEKADITLRTSFERWVTMAIRDSNPVREVLKGKLRPSGSPRKLLQLQKIFPQRQTETLDIS